MPTIRYIVYVGSSYESPVALYVDGVLIDIDKDSPDIAVIHSNDFLVGGRAPSLTLAGIEGYTRTLKLARIEELRADAALMLARAAELESGTAVTS